MSGVSETILSCLVYADYLHRQTKVFNLYANTMSIELNLRFSLANHTIPVLRTEWDHLVARRQGDAQISAVAFNMGKCKFSLAGWIIRHV